jgi:hypothetical protein
MSQFNTPSYEIPRTSGVCASNGRELVPGEAYYAALIELTEAQLAEAAEDTAKAGGKSGGSAKDKAIAALTALGMCRIDISSDAWEDGYRPDGLFGYWKSTVPEPNQKKKMFVDDGMLMNLLERLADATEPDRLAFRYVLALILMRKKLLRYDGNETRAAEVDGETVEQTWWKLTPKLDLAKGMMGKWHPDVRLEVLDPKIDETAVEQVMTQLGDILQAEF